MKPEMITLKHGQSTIKMPASALAQLAMASVFAQVLPPANTAPVSPVPSAVPAVGTEWPGQGGINGGLVAARGDVPAHYLIVAAKDVGKHAWGGREKESKATSKTDGLANALALIEEGGHPAAVAAQEHQAEGHADFYLPAAAELYHYWLTCPEVFAKDTWYWSSSQRSAYGAFGMYFDVGSQYYYDKGDELRVRPVRRLFI
ncbi:hypothetical protein PMM47T1_14080 [Pseudomonas sp. M47T1]|uniref:DUF1566 domain-containing protein n=1 Tax=Pseudomonas sp. M47T1 TaxID=1179778 RepID=UPI000260883C|nr:DUF1566 domain-containing protein [Pseudomonas sp. M47T1]EIK96094.1 hypothetical protein PMM47T1_14080 [Pseudomonas sp. M47T1]